MYKYSGDEYVSLLLMIALRCVNVGKTELFKSILLTCFS